MRHLHVLRWATAIIVAGALLVPLAPRTSRSAEWRGGHSLVIGPDVIINDDLYVGAGTIEIQGRVNGDVCACGGTILLSGRVTGDLFTAGGNTTVSGIVNGTMRSAGGNITVTGTVGEDVLAGCGSFTLSSGAHVGRDVLLGSGSAALSGHVARDVGAGAGRLSIDGTVGGDVASDVGELHLGDTAVLEGDLNYASRHELERAPGATVRGKIERRASTFKERPTVSPEARALWAILGWVRGLIGFTAFGLLFLLPFPEQARRFVSALSASPWASVGLGLLLLVGVPFVGLFALILGLMIGGWWIGASAMFLFGLVLILGFVAIGYFVGQWIFARFGPKGVHRAWALLAGLAVVLFVTRIPILGCLVGALGALFGVGALALALARPAKGRKAAT